VRIAALHQPVYDDLMRGIALIQVGESLDARRALWRTILFDTLWRQAALVVAVAVLAWVAVHFVLLPFMRLKGELERRSSTDLSDFEPASVHREVRPLVFAMNGYMARLKAMLAGQRRFIADASHQLRTPLTVLKTQTELALRETDPREMREIVESIYRTTDATVHLANRLLTLARAEHRMAEGGLEPLSLLEAARQVGLELAQNAVAKGIDLSLEPSDEVKVNGHPLLLHEMIANLVENAIRYTPAGGTVMLRVRGGAQPVLEIEDSGPGIAPEERERVFAPFYRSPSAHAVHADGSGLGLTIVREIAAFHGAAVTLSERAQGGGLKVDVSFPAA
jgi:two-component system sensor histidine kinase TctE